MTEQDSGGAKSWPRCLYVNHFSSNFPRGDHRFRTSNVKMECRLGLELGRKGNGMDGASGAMQALPFLQLGFSANHLTSGPATCDKTATKRQRLDQSEQRTTALWPSCQNDIPAPTLGTQAWILGNVDCESVCDEAGLQRWNIAVQTEVMRGR